MITRSYPRLAKARLTPQQRTARRIPVWNRWLVVKARTRDDWHDWIADVWYLVRG